MRRGRRGDAGARRCAREGARARRRDRAWGAWRREARGASRDRRGESRRSAVRREWRRAQRHRYDSRISLERVERGGASRESSARARLPERRSRTLPFPSSDGPERRRRTWKCARPEWRPVTWCVSFGAAERNHALRRKGPARRVVITRSTRRDLSRKKNRLVWGIALSLWSQSGARGEVRTQRR